MPSRTNKGRAYHKKKFDCFFTSTQCSQHQGGLTIWICKINISLHFKQIQYCFIVTEQASIHNSSPIATISRIRVYMTPKQNSGKVNVREKQTEVAYSWEFYLSMRCLTLEVMPRLAAVWRLKGIKSSSCNS